MSQLQEWNEECTMVANLFQWAIHLSWSEAEDSQSTFFIGLVSGLSLAHTSSWVAVNGSQICCVRWQSDPGVLVAATTEITLSYSHSRWSLFEQKEVFSLPFQLPDWVWTFTCCIFSNCWVPWTQSFNPNPSSVFSQSLIKPHSPLVTQWQSNPNLWFVNR